MKTDKIKAEDNGGVGNDPAPFSWGEKPHFFTNKIFCAAVFLLFMAIITATAFSVPLFGDDYYYAYFVKKGADFFVSENIVHYMETNGRALVHLIDELLLGFGIWPWRIFVILAVCAAVFLLAKCISGFYGKRGMKNEKFRYALVLSCIAFGSLTLPVLRQSVWWATGSLNYLFPTVLLILLWCLFEKIFTEEGKAKTATLIFAAVTALITGMSTEQVSFASVMICIWFTFRPLIEKKKFKLIFPVCALLSVIGFLTLYLAPGNAVRTEFYPEFYSLGILDRIYENSGELFCVAFGKEGMFTSVIAMLAVFTVRKVFFAFSEKNVTILARLVSFGEAVVTAATCVVYVYALTEWDEYFTYSGASDDAISRVLMMCLGVSTVLVFIDTLKRLIINKDQTFMFYGGAVVLQLAMLISPQFGSRTVLVSAVLLFIAAFRDVFGMKLGCQTAALGIFSTAIAILTFYQEQSEGVAIMLMAAAVYIMLCVIKKIRSHSIAVVAAVLVCFCGMWGIFKGYHENYEVHRQNEAIVSEYLMGEKTEDTIYLYRLPNSEHKYTMPYDDPYHMFRYKALYGIPGYVQVVYVN